jgi:putative tricarboxylic transport membrane protein
MGMTMVIYLSGRSILKGGIMAVVGLILGCVGMDLVSGKSRFTLGIPYFDEGIDIAPMVMGLFGISEVLANLAKPEERDIFKARVSNLLPSLDDWRRSIFPIVRGSVLGFFLGIVPGGGGVLASFLSYAAEKRISRHPEEFGKGAIEGVAGPETANNSAIGGAFIPLFALGIPSNVVMAILLASLMVHGVAPGPGFIAKNPELFWGVVASMYVGNVMLVILNLPLIGVWVKILKIPYRILFPLILFFCVIGAYSINSRTFDVIVMVVFGVAGYVLKELDYEPAPLALAFVLGPMFELSFRQTMIIASHNLFFLFSRPIALTALLIAALLILSRFISYFRKGREKAVNGV